MSSPANIQGPQGPPQCVGCRHHFVTYDPSLPHGCRLFGMRTRAMPCTVVQGQTGELCQGYEPRPATPEKG